MSILVAGAGPAGARLATRLALAGRSVTLVDPLPDPHRNAYSSAALPLEDALQLSLPQHCWSSCWQGWQLIDPQGLEHQWWSETTQGVVLDFGRLRETAWEAARAAGVELITGWRVKLDRLHADSAEVLLRNGRDETLRRKVRWLVDATGAQRVLLRQAGVAIDSPDDPLLVGQGVEWLVQADERNCARWNDRLTFLLGCCWVPHGYGWIFPMSDHRLKVGVCRLPGPTANKESAGLKSQLEALLLRCGLKDFPVLDRHGGVVSSTVRRHEPHGQGALLAVGDAVSTANLLGGEGIRHALNSAEILADVLLTHAGSHHPAEAVLDRYNATMRKIFGLRWRISGRLARRTWWGLNSNRADQRLEKLIGGLSEWATAEDLSELLFRYKFERYGWRVLPYLI